MKNNVNPEFQMKIDALMEDDYDDDFYDGETGEGDASDGGSVLSDEEERILRGSVKSENPQRRKKKSPNSQAVKSRDEKSQSSQRNQRPRRKHKDMSVNDYKRKIVIYRFIALALVAIIVILLCRTVIRKMNQGMPVDTTEIFDETITFKVDYNIEGLSEELPTIKALIEDNYLKYLNKAYVLIGTYPECEYYKISANVTRNEFDWSKDFYVNDKGLYYTYYKDGVDSGRVAIDVSEFQKTIEWDKVKAAGIDIAIIRAGYRGYGTGEIHGDSMASTNLSGAAEAGLETGVYFFSAAINRDEGVAEAQYCLDLVKDYDIKQPIVIDTEMVFEDDSARSNNITVEDRTAAVVGFCETIEAAGYTPMIYASRDQFIKYLDVDAIGKWEFWLAAYDTPVFPYHTEGYQYTPYGYVDGIPTQVDLDVWMR